MFDYLHGRLSTLVLALSILSLVCFSIAFAQLDPELSIVVDSSGTYPAITLENSVFRATIRVNYGGSCGTEHAIRDWVIKAYNEDQVDSYIDACAIRGPLERASIVWDSDTLMTVRAEFDDCSRDPIRNSATIEYSIFPNSPVIKIDYIKFPWGWANVVDSGTPGGSSYGGQYRFYGAGEYAEKVRGYDIYPDSYWNTYDGGKYSNDPPTAGSLNYKNDLIMTVGNSAKGHGFGRVIPIYKKDVRGGATIVKLLWNNGFEIFPKIYSRPYVSYLFVFDNGTAKAVQMGQMIANGDMLIGGYSAPDVPDCDFNGDGEISIADVVALVAYQRSNPDSPRSDFNGDGDTNILDVVELLLAQLNGWCTN